PVRPSHPLLRRGTARARLHCLHGAAGGRIRRAEVRVNRDTTLNGGSLLRPRRIALVAGLGSLALLAGAFLFQFAGGLQPCPLCIWQRWPHAVAGVLGLIALATPLRPIALLGLATTLLGAGIAGYHTGVEQGWWQG